MKKKISNNLFLLALCMQYGSGTVVAEQGTMVFTNISVDKNDVSRRLMRLEDQLSALSEKDLYVMEKQLDEIDDVFEDAGERGFKQKSIDEKREYIQRKLREYSYVVGRSNLLDKDKAAISEYIEKMEKVVAQPVKTKALVKKKK